MNVLVTGCAGFIGMHTCVNLIKRGFYVTGIDNLNSYYSVDLKSNRLDQINSVVEGSSGQFKFFKADLNSDIWSDLEGTKFDIIIHLAAQAGVRYSIENPQEYINSNIHGFNRICEFTIKQGTTRFIYASSSSVYGKDSTAPFNESSPCNSPESFYAATKKANELMAKSYFHSEGLNSVGLRFFTVYGPWGRPDMAAMLFADAAFNNKQIKVYNYGKQQRDFTYIDDIVQGMINLALSPKFPKGAEIFNIGNGSPVKLMEFINQIEISTSSKLEKKFVEAQKGDVTLTYSDTSKLSSLINYSSTTPIEKGIEKFIKWYKKYYKIS
jgi:UDP-glucuronate 4-epimerase